MQFKAYKILIYWEIVVYSKKHIPSFVRVFGRVLKPLEFPEEDHKGVFCYTQSPWSPKDGTSRQRNQPCD